MAEGARLECVFTRKGNVVSNPTLSAIFFNSLACAPLLITCYLRLEKRFSHSLRSYPLWLHPRKYSSLF